MVSVYVVLLSNRARVLTPPRLKHARVWASPAVIIYPARGAHFSILFSASDRTVGDLSTVRRALISDAHLVSHAGSAKLVELRGGSANIYDLAPSARRASDPASTDVYYLVFIM